MDKFNLRPRLLKFYEFIPIYYKHSILLYEAVTPRIHDLGTHFYFLNLHQWTESAKILDRLRISSVLSEKDCLIEALTFVSIDHTVVPKHNDVLLTLHEKIETTIYSDEHIHKPWCRILTKIAYWTIYSRWFRHNLSMINCYAIIVLPPTSLQVEPWHIW